VKERKLLLDVAPFKVYPPVAGAHHAVYYADEALSKYWDVFLFSTGVRKDTLRFLPGAQETEINSHFREYSYVTASILPLNYLTRQGAGVPQVYASRYLAWSKPQVLVEKTRECDVIQVEMPWQAGYVARINEMRKPLILVAHNVEARLWERFESNCRKSSYRSWIRNEISRQERGAIDLADAVIAVSEMDREALIELYGVEDRKVSVIPWGVDVNRYRFYSVDEKGRAKESLGLSGRRVVVFSGALYEPNVEAVRFILNMAGEFGPDTLFLVVGRVGEAFAGESIPTNIMFTGFVDDPVRYFAAADVGINPMQSGGGMHLKMLEYLSTGLPTVTTEVGARGFRRPWEDYIMVSDLKGFAGAVRSMLEDASQREHYGRQGRATVGEFYSWDKVARDRISLYEGLTHLSSPNVSIGDMV
jgi:glycosyltransferase involved in cell wall biosynthesis